MIKMVDPDLLISECGRPGRDVWEIRQVQGRLLLTVSLHRANHVVLHICLASLCVITRFIIHWCGYLVNVMFRSRG